MKNKILLIVCFALIGIYSCSSDDDKSDVNFINAKFNNVEQKFNIISVDKVDYIDEGYSDVIVTAKMSSDASKIIILKSEYGVTGDIIWGIYYTTDGTYYENDTESSNVTENSNGRYKGTFSGSLSSEGGGTIMITDGSFDIIYQ
ncbi:hypothetical protein M0M57_11485 [Flavobacterium azooxidireducens]|uniref:Lipoprotein n=1 Tax=Flavobacterium azooxidireducens TaxID=1871076 RepID=A0ABY4KD68_9FLAO|nr:hypothetical protein [Flavobacterium azooxidireducens]UPQ78240.1 hypothetical protein M0M57_11485 [Flavobacterium azooxidireducens]